MSFPSVSCNGWMRRVESACKWLIMNVFDNQNKSYLSVC